MRRSLPYLQPKRGLRCWHCARPPHWPIISGTLVVWAGSQFFGVGKIVDVILLVIGAATIGWSAWQLGKELYAFATGLIDPGPPPPGTGALYKPTISRPTTLPSGALGETNWYGNISVTRLQSIEEQRLTLYHEWVYSVLSPRLRYLQQLRAASAPTPTGDRRCCVILKRQ
jgi:hypothetical protein